MTELNYLRIAQLLGGTVTEIQQPSFGVLGAAQASVERFRLLHHNPQEQAVIPMSENADIAAAFEKVRQGFEPDRVLVDPVLYKRFIAEVRRAGVKASEVLVNRRLQAFRKSAGYGVKLQPTTKDAELDADPYFYAAEMGFVQLTYLKNVSVDDVITDPAVGKEFVALCKQIAPHGDGMIFKWAALRLRKMRYFSPKKVGKLLSLPPEEIEDHLGAVGTLDQISIKSIPEDRGLFSLAEQNGKSKYLYVGSSDNLRVAVSPFQDAEPFKAISGPFWKVPLGDICLKVAVVRKQLLGATARDLSLRLIEERRPLFNMPVRLEPIEEAA